ncbi:MAG: CopG family transcriptional regulator [Betaproteobacteria bacterium]|nr:CopG family transcriptional regulator [Betaproteobacteria bacterium]
MGQVTIYLDKDTEQEARAAARAEGVPLSKWVARQLRGRPRGEWPQAVRALAGSWVDAPSLKTIRRYKAKDIGSDRV